MSRRGLHVRPRIGSDYDEELLSLSAFSDGIAARRLARPSDIARISRTDEQRVRSVTATTASPKRALARRSECRAILHPEYLRLGGVTMNKSECAASTRVRHAVKTNEEDKKKIFRITH